MCVVYVLYEFEWYLVGMVMCCFFVNLSSVLLVGVYVVLCFVCWNMIGMFVVVGVVVVWVVLCDMFDGLNVLKWMCLFGMFSVCSLLYRLCMNVDGLYR